MNRAEALPHYLASLAKFRVEFGHTNVPRTFATNPALAAWVRSVRNGWREGRLHEIHIAQLTEAGFSFAPHDDAWKAQYDKLKLYVQENGDAKVPRDYEDRALAIWVMHQRSHLKEGLLEDSEIELLKQLNFIFDPHDYQWSENMKRLAAFKHDHGHALVPRRYPKDTKLADFCAEIRTRFKAGNLSEKQVADLIEAEFVFDPIDAVWSQRLSDYADWRGAGEHGDLPPRRIAGAATPLYEWCRVQLRNLAENKMLEDRRARLAAAGFPVATA